MNKIKIGIDIDEIFRAKWLQFDRYYYQEFGAEGIPTEQLYTYDFFNTYEWNRTKENMFVLKDDFPEDINPLDYVQDENGHFLAENFIFNTEKIDLSARETYNKFMYEDYLFEIFGSAPLMYKGIDLDLKNFLYKYINYIDVTVFSVENVHSIPPTLFFLSRIMSRFNTYKFLEKSIDIISDVDVIITTDPALLLAELPENKTIIKVKRPYNTDIQSEKEILQLADLINNAEFEKLVNFKNEENVRE
jgi:hypothetical protein